MDIFPPSLFLILRRLLIMCIPIHNSNKSNIHNSPQTDKQPTKQGYKNKVIKTVCDRIYPQHQELQQNHNRNCGYIYLQFPAISSVAIKLWLQLWPHLFTISLISRIVTNSNCSCPCLQFPTISRIATKP